MAETLSTMLPLGTPLPSFSLPDAVSGKPVTSTAARGSKGTLVMFLCNHCPFVQHVMPELGRLGRDYAPKGIAILAINSNDLVAYPQDGPPHMKELATSEDWTFPFLMDESQAVAREFQAACTPDFFLFDGAGKLAYRGRLDETRPKSGAAPHGSDLRAALDAVVAGGAPATEQKPSVGCNIKWKELSPKSA
ncbi:MAG: thioredoxin family protein [Candidatus Eiseniibacteriota bacterium]